jgi:hypothetical protein
LLRLLAPPPLVLVLVVLVRLLSRRWTDGTPHAARTLLLLSVQRVAVVAVFKVVAAVAAVAA